MRISVIIPAYNEEKVLGTCLESIKNQTVKPDEIIVIDNNSTDKTASIAKRYGATVVPEKEQGMIQARNKGFNSAKYEIIARTDADTIVPPTWIAYIKEKFEKDKELLGISGPGKYIDETFTNLLKFPTIIYFDSFKSIMGHDCFFGPNIAIRKIAWEKIKDSVCLDDKDVHEDADLAIHLAKIGKIVFDQNLVVTVSARRWKKLSPYVEYPFRYLKTLQKHQTALVTLTEIDEKATYFGRKIQKAAKRLAKQITTL